MEMRALGGEGIWSYSAGMFVGSSQDQKTKRTGLEGRTPALAMDPGPGRRTGGGSGGSSWPELYRLGWGGWGH